MKLLKVLLLGSIMSLMSYTAQAQTVEVYPVQQFWGPIMHEVCTEYRRDYFDPFHNVVSEDFYTTCIFPDGSIQTYTPDVYRSWEWYPQIIINPFGFLHGHEHEHEHDRNSYHHRR